MAVFSFTVNSSVLKGTIHIPKSQVSHRVLEAEGFSQRNWVIIFPHGEQFEGQLYHYEPRYKEYYQLHLRGKNRILPTYIQLHDFLFMVLFKFRKRNYAIVEYPNKTISS